MPSIRNIISSIILCFILTLGFAQTKIDSLKQALNTSIKDTDKLDLLDSLTVELIKSNSPEQERYLKQYLGLAGELKAYDQMASKSRFLIQYYVYTNRNELAQKFCDSLLGFKDYFKNESSEAHLVLKRGGTYYNQERYDKAIDDYSKASELFLRSGDSIFAADAYFFMAQVNTDINSFIEAIANYEKAMELYELLGDDQYVIFVGSSMTVLYSKNGFVEKSLEERKRLLEKAVVSRDFASQGQIYGQNITDYYKLGNYDQMKMQITDLQRVSDSLKGTFTSSYYDLVALNYNLIYECELGNVANANDLFQQLEEKSNDEDLIQYLKTDLLDAKAAYYELVGDKESLLSILETFSNIKSTNRINSQTRARDKLIALYKSRGQYKKAFELKELNTIIKDSVYNAQKLNTFLYYQAEYETQKKQQELLEQDAEIQRLEAEQQFATANRNTITGITIAVFAITIVFFYFRNKHKVKEQAYQNILLNNKIATKTEEINLLLTETIQHIKSKERIAEDLQKLSKADQNVSLKSIIADLKASKSDDAKLMLIKQNIEQANFEFIKQLKEQHPGLTKTDIEICSLIRIGLSRNEVANLRNTSLEAVKSSRSRLKKKLKLNKDQNLDVYLKSL